MKKVLITVIIGVMLVITVGIMLDDISQNDKMRRCETIMMRTSKMTGMEYLGFVKTWKYNNDSEMIRKELLKRAGLNGNYDAWVDYVEDHGNICICMITVFENDTSSSNRSKNVVGQYLYGEIF